MKISLAYYDILCQLATVGRSESIASYAIRKLKNTKGDSEDERINIIEFTDIGLDQVS